MSKPVEAIVVDADGELLMWHAGGVHGPKGLVREVEFNAALNLPVELAWGTPPVAASLEDPDDDVAILAALLSAAPGRCSLLQGSPKIEAWYAAVADEPGVVY